MSSHQLARRLFAGAITLAVPAAAVLGPLGGTADAAANSRVKRAPAPVFTAVPSSPTNVSAASFAWTGLNATTNYTCTLDGSRVPCAAASGSTAWTYTSGDLADGSHTFSVKAQGHKQNPANYSWRVDTLPPAAPSVVAPPSSTRATSAAISFTDTDPAVVAVTCSLDGGAPAACQTPFVVADLANGGHAVTVTAYDAAHNAASSSVSWTVDPNAPDVPVVTGPASPTSRTDASIAFSTVNPARYACSLDGAAASSCTSPATVTGLADGAHTFRVAATDTAGNTFSDRAMWVVDTVAPAAPTLVSGPAAVTDDTSPSVVFTDTDATGVRFTCTVTDTTSGVTAVATTPCASPFDMNLDPNTPDGDQFIAHVVPTDGAGNVGAALDVSWVLDQTISPSPAKFLVTPTAASADRQPTFTFDAPDYGQSQGATGFLCTLNDAAVSCPGTVDATGSTLTGTYQPASPLADGSYTFAVRTTNGAAQSQAITWVWALDTAPPAAPQVSDPGATANPTVTFVDADPTVTYLCSVDGGAQVACSSPWNPPSGLADGTHTLVVTAVDAAGNRTTGPSINFVVQHEVTPDTTSTQPATQPAGGSQPSAGGSQPAGGSQADTTAPAVSGVAVPRTLTASAVVTFDEPVTGLAAGSARLVVAGQTVAVPGTVACLSGGTVVGCGTSYTAVRITPAAPLTLGQRYAVVADAGATHDAAGHASAASSTAFRAARAVEESSPAVKAAWPLVKARRAFGGSAVREHLAGATATWTFRGTSVTWWTVTGSDQGRAVVLVDGVKKAAIDNWSATTRWRVGRTVKGLRPGTHRLTVKVLGRKGAKSGKGTLVTVDAFTVGRTRTASPVLATTLRSVAGSAFSAGHAWSGDLKGEAVRVSFRGTSISWTTMRGRTQGKAAVYVDGVLRGTYDGFATKTSYRVTRSVGKLADRLHTLRIVVLGRHHKGATGSLVTVDRVTAG